MMFTEKFLIRWVSLFSLLLVSGHGLSAERYYIDHCLHGCPTAKTGSDLVVQHIFAASVDDNGLAEWVAYRVFDGTIGVASLLPRFWQEDRLLPSNSGVDVASSQTPRFVQPDIADSQDSDYRVTEVLLLNEDRGRLVPMTSFANTPYWSELNLLTNMAPLPASLRIGPWSRLDQAVNEASAKIEKIFVVSGPVPQADKSAEQQSIEGFFKIVATSERLAVFYFPSDTLVHRNHCDYQSDLETIQDATGINFYPRFQGSWQSNLAPELGCEFFK